MRAIRDRVLVKQEFTKIEKKIFLLDDEKNKNDGDRYEVVSTILGLGGECPTGELSPGDKVFINQHSEPAKAVNITKNADNTQITNHAIFYYTDIIAVDE